MPEIHMYITAILAFFLALLGGTTGWLLLTVISNQSRIAVLELAISNVAGQLTEIKAQLGRVDTGIGELHARINSVWREAVAARSGRAAPKGEEKDAR